MKKAIYLFQYFVLFFLAVGCKDKTLIEPPIKEFLNTLWTLESFDVEGEVVTPPKDQIYTIQFKNDSTFSGKSDCNDIWGHYTLGQNHSLTISNLVTTKKGCGEKSMGERYFEALLVVKSYRIDTNKLSIYYGQNSKLNFIDK